MKFGHIAIKKNTMMIVACVLVVAACVGLVFFVTMRGGYETVKNSSPGSTASSSRGDTQVGTKTQKTTLPSAQEKQGISVTVQGNIPKELDLIRYVKQAYELKYFMAIASFSSEEELPVNPLVQYAFCYLYAGDGCLVDYTPAAMTYRQATEKEIREQAVKLFGACTQDLTKSDLYTSGKQCFEMWQPDYHDDVYATASARPANGGYELSITYYEDSKKTKSSGNATVTIKQTEEGLFYLASMAE